MAVPAPVCYGRRGYEMERRGGPLLAAGVVIALVLAAAVSAGDRMPSRVSHVEAGPPGSVSAKDPVGDVRGKGLTAAERKALDIVSVGVVRDPFGVVVTVRLRGDFDQAVGRGHLKAAAVGVILTPPQGKPWVVLTRGAGRREETVAGIPSRSARQPKGPFATIRKGVTLTFFATGYTQGLKRIEVKTLAALPTGRRALAAATGTPDIFLRVEPTDQNSLSPGLASFPNLSSLSCEELKRLLEEKSDEVDEVRDSNLRGAVYERLIKRLKKEKNGIFAEIEKRCKPKPPPPTCTGTIAADSLAPPGTSGYNIKFDCGSAAIVDSFDLTVTTTLIGGNPPAGTTNLRWNPATLTATFDGPWPAGTKFSFSVIQTPPVKCPSTDTITVHIRSANDQKLKIGVCQ